MAQMAKTIHGENFWEMLSMMQKASRRGDFEDAGYAAYELASRYYTALWNRIMVVSSEDCCGAFTKELVKLRVMDDEANSGLPFLQKDLSYLSRAVKILSEVNKSRDACYWGCNFMIAYEFNSFRVYETTEDEQKAMKCKLDSFNESDMNYQQMTADKMTIPGEAFSQETFFFVEDEPIEIKYRYAAEFKKAIEKCDMETSGRILAFMRQNDRDTMWKTFLCVSDSFGGVLNREVIALKMADDWLNKKKPLEKKEDIFVCKAAVLLLYQSYGKEEWLKAHDMIDPEQFTDWSGHECKDISECTMPEGKIPDWVFDVHTWRGKRMGKTDWDMNIDEQAALTPLRRCFFDDGNWKSFYEWLRKNDMANPGKFLSKGEWEAHMAYREGRYNNPITKDGTLKA